MTYGTIKVDTVTFTDAGIDKSVTLSGLVQNPTFSGNVTVTGTLSGVTVTGTTANFTSGNFTNISGGTHTITSGVFAAGSAASPSITFTGDLNTGIYSPGADQVAISTGGSGRLFVDASGNVGVGSISTSSFQSASSTVLSLRDVATGNVASLKVLGGTGAGAIAEYGASNGIGFCGTSGAHAFTFYTNSAERLRITSAGLVGVGTSSPSRPLHVVGSAVFDDGTVQATIWPQIATNVAGFGTNNNYPVALVTNGSQRLHVTAAGNVGIGTNTVNTTLEVLNSSTPIIRVGDGTRHVQLWGGSSTQNQAVGTATSASFNININSSPVATFDTSGRLLVGTSTVSSNGTPRAQIDGGDLIVGATGTGAVGRLISVGTGTSGARTTDMLGELRFASLENSNWGPCIRGYGVSGQNYDQNQLTFHTLNVGGGPPVERMRIGNDGTTYFGVTGAPSGSIGGSAFLAESDSRRTLYMASTTTGGTTLQVFRNPNGQIGSITTSGSTTAFNTSSDYRLKENVVPVNDGITRLQQLKPSRFNFIVEPGKTVDGFIAHEVQAVVPEAIHGTKDAVDADGNPIYQGIDQSKLVPLLTAALQEAISEIESLKARLTAAGI